MSITYSFLQAKLRNKVLLDEVYTRPDTVYIGMDRYYDWLVDSETSEVDSTEYARQPLNLSDMITESGVDRPSAGMNDTEIVFPPPESHWGLAGLFTIWDAETDGNALYYCAPNQTVGADAYSFISNKSHARFYLNDNPDEGESITVDGITYTFTVLVVNPYDVKIAVTKEDTLANLIAAINFQIGEGTKYGTGTLIHPTCECPDVEVRNQTSPSFPVGVVNDRARSRSFFIVTYKLTGTGTGTEISSNCAQGFWDSDKLVGGEVPLTIPVREVWLQTSFPQLQSCSEALEAAIFAWLKNGTDFTIPTNWEIRLFSDDLDGNTEGTELTFPTYQRADVAWTMKETRGVNEAQLYFGYTDTESWIIRSWGAYDKDTGDYWFGASYGSPYTIPAGGNGVYIPAETIGYSG